MMNIFTTFPAFIQLKSALDTFNAHEPEFEALKAAGEYEELRSRVKKGYLEFADTLVKRWKLEIEVIGKENMPESGPVLIVSNHQSYADILMMCYACDKFQTGYIAKSEFGKVKILAKAIKNTQSLFITRGDAREAVNTLKTATEMFNNGFSFVIYPEGTRSKGREMREFKPGSFKFAQKAKVPILPVTVDGGWRIFEETGSFKKGCKFRVIIHPLVHYEQMTRQEQHEAIKDIENTIREGLNAYDPL